MTELRARSSVLHAQASPRRSSARWWAFGVLVSLLLHGAAAAALLAPWGRGADFEAGGIVTVEVVALSGPGAQPAGPAAEAWASFEDTARPHPEPVAETAARTVEAQKSALTPAKSDAGERARPEVPPERGTTAERARVEQETPPPPPPQPDGLANPSATDTAEAVTQPAEAPPPVPAPKPDAVDDRPTQAAEEAAVDTTRGRPASAARQTARLPHEKTGSPAGSGTAANARPGGGGGSGAAPLSGNPQPEYPYRARERHWEGRVVLRVLVGADGQPERVTVLSSSGYDVLDDAALDAIRRWRFQPARRAGRPVGEELEIPVRFALKD